MPKPRKDQKKIAQQYAGNLRYFSRLHPLRPRAAAVDSHLHARGHVGRGDLPAALAEPVRAASRAQRRPTKSRTIAPRCARTRWFNSAGGISQAHARYAQDCAKCHDPAINANAAQTAVIKASLDARCQVCHNNPPYNFHQLNTVASVGFPAPTAITSILARGRCSRSRTAIAWFATATPT